MLMQWGCAALFRTSITGLIMTTIVALSSAASPMSSTNTVCIAPNGENRVNCPLSNGACPSTCCWINVWANQTPCYYPYDYTAFLTAVSCTTKSLSGNSCFKYYAGPKSWAAAFKACANVPANIVGRLAWIRDLVTWGIVINSLTGTVPASANSVQDSVWFGMYKWRNSALRWMRSWSGANNLGYYVNNHVSVNQSTHGPVVIPTELLGLSTFQIEYAAESTNYLTDTTYTTTGIAFYQSLSLPVYIDDVESATKAFLCEYVQNPSTNYDLVSQTPSPSNPFMCGDNGWYDQSASHKACYWLSAYGVWDWERQQFYCRNVGGQLPTFSNISDYDKFQTFRENEALMNGPMWLGLRHPYTNSTSTFKWVDRTPFNWQHWSASTVHYSDLVTIPCAACHRFWAHAAISYGINLRLNDGYWAPRSTDWGYPALCQKRTSACPAMWTACATKAASNLSVINDASCYVKMNRSDDWRTAVTNCMNVASSGLALGANVIGRLAWIPGRYAWNDVKRLIKPNETVHIGLKLTTFDPSRLYWIYNHTADGNGTGDIAGWLLGGLNAVARNSAKVAYYTDGVTWMTENQNSESRNYICEYRCAADVLQPSSSQRSYIPPNLPPSPVPLASCTTCFFMLANIQESCSGACSRRGGTFMLGRMLSLTAVEVQDLFLSLGVECVFDTMDQNNRYSPWFLEPKENEPMSGTCYGVRTNLGSALEIPYWHFDRTRRACHCTAPSCYTTLNAHCAANHGVLHNGACFIQYNTSAVTWADAFTQCSQYTSLGFAGRLAWLPYSNDWRVIRNKLFYLGVAVSNTSQTLIGLRRPSGKTAVADFRWYSSPTVPQMPVYFTPDELYIGTFNISTDPDKQCIVIDPSSPNTWIAVSCDSFKGSYLCEYTCADMQCAAVGGVWKYSPGSNPSICYALTEPLMTWEDAKQRCWEMGASLPVILSAAEFAQFKNGTGQTYGLMGYYHSWLGARDFDHDEQQRWIDGSSFDTSMLANAPWQPAQSRECMYVDVTQKDMRDYPCESGLITSCQKRQISNSLITGLVNQAYCRVLHRCPNNTEVVDVSNKLKLSWNTKDIVKFLVYSAEFNNRFIANVTSGTDRLAALYDALYARELTNGSYGEVITDANLFPEYRTAVDKLLKSDYYNYRFYMDKIPGGGRIGCSNCQAGWNGVECPSETKGWYRSKRCYYQLVTSKATQEDANWTCLYSSSTTSGHPYATLPLIRDIQDVNDLEYFRSMMKSQGKMPTNAIIWLDGISWGSGIMNVWDQGSPTNFSLFLPGQPDVNPQATPPTYPPYCLASTGDHRWDDIDCLTKAYAVCQVCAPLDDCPLSTSITTWNVTTPNDTLCINASMLTFFTSLTTGFNGAIVIDRNGTVLGNLSQAVVDALNIYQLSASTTTDKRFVMTTTIDGQLQVRVIASSQGADLILCEKDKEEPYICPEDWQQSDPTSPTCYKMFTMNSKYPWDIIECPEGSTRFVPDLTTVGSTFAQFIYYIGVGQVCPNDHFNVAGNCYKVGDISAASTLKYKKAVEHCSQKDSSLPIFDSMDHFDALRIPLRAFTSGFAWIDAGSYDGDGRYNWIGSELFGYGSGGPWFWRNGDLIEDFSLVWSPGEPANSTHDRQVVLDLYNGRLTTTPLGSSHLAICQCDITPNLSNSSECKPLDKVFPTTTKIDTTTTKPYPMSATEALAAQVFQTMGCTFLLVSMGTTVGIFLLLRDFSIERCLHMGQETCIFAGHMLVLTMRDRINDLFACRLAGVGFQLFFTGVFSFMFLEAVQYYAILTNIINTGGFIKRWMFVASAVAIPIATTFATAVLEFGFYNAEWTCWANLGHNVSLGTLIPVIALSCLTLIVTEAATMGHHKRMPLVNKLQYRTAHVNQKGMLFILPANVTSWFLGLFAVYYVKIGLFTTVFVLNVVLAVCVFTFHVMGNVAANRMVHKFFGRWFKSCQLKDQTYAPEPEKPKPNMPSKPVYTG